MRRIQKTVEPLHVKAERALKAAIEGTIEEHRRLGLPLVFYRNGRVVHVSANRLKPAKGIAGKRSSRVQK